MYILDFLYLENQRMTLFCNLFMELPSYMFCISLITARGLTVSSVL